MPWLAVDEDGIESIHVYRPERQCLYNRVEDSMWGSSTRIELPTGTIKILLAGKELTWKDKPVEYTAAPVSRDRMSIQERLEHDIANNFRKSITDFEGAFKDEFTAETKLLTLAKDEQGNI